MQLGTEHGLSQGSSSKLEFKPSASRRLWEGALTFIQGALPSLRMSLEAFLLTFVNWLGVPSPCAAAYLLATPTRGIQALFPLLGVMASLFFRLLSNVQLDIWQYVGCVGLWLALLLYRPKTLPGIAAAAGLAMMPRVIAALVEGAPLPILLGCAAIPLCMGLTVAFQRGAVLIRDARPILTLPEKAFAILLMLSLVCGLGYLRLWTINMGHVAALVCTLYCAYALGGTAGATAGLLCGAALALCGHESRLALHLALGGLAAGLTAGTKRRWLCALACFAGHMVGFFLTPFSTPALPHVTATLACVLFPLTWKRPVHRLQSSGLASVPSARGMEGLFVEQRLLRWESAMRAMSSALPSLPPSDSASFTGEDLVPFLCTGCPQREICFGRNHAETIALLDEIMDFTLAGEPIGAHYPNLDECPCQRLESAPAAVAQLLQAHHQELAAQAKARFEQAMTITHLTAMADAIAEIRALTGGETLGDLQAAYQINKTIRDLHYPGSLCYARRVDGHLQAAIETETLAPLGKQPHKLLRHLQEEAGLSLGIVRTMKNRTELEELPLYSVELGVANLCAGQQTAWEEERVCGDAIAAKQFPGGRFVLLLSDGMGHGANAHTVSNKTLELLLLCLEAGYTRRQAITAVNGMILSATDAEGFATVDLMDISLWSGDIQSEKLGASASWLVRGNYIKQVEGSSLPLGILEEVEPTSQSLRIHSGDILILMSDGAADVLGDGEQMERAISESLYIQPQRMADALLRCALLASEGIPKDDMTVVVLLMVDKNRSDASAEDSLKA